MKEQFEQKGFGPAATSMIETVNQILDEYKAEGYDLSLRQLYYQLVSRNIVENTERSYKNVGTLISNARYAGLVDWDMIKDRGREMVQNSHWNSPAEIVDACARQFRVDRWADQPCYVEVMVEKQALEGVLVPVCAEMDVPFTANKGYSSSTALYEASKRYLRRAQGKELYVLYLGDHDPSGIDMSRDVLDRMELFVNTSLGEDAGVKVNRLALNMDQIDELKPPENPAKLTDSRADGYVKKFGTSSWELDAIEPKRLAALVRDAVNGLIDRKAWKASGERQDKFRADLKAFAENYTNL